MLDKGYGYQNISSKKKSNANTMYLIGSTQKFTTGLILKHLELSNKININDLLLSICLGLRQIKLLP